MKQRIATFLFIISSIIFITSCYKDYSLERGQNNNGLSTGSLKDSLGNCQNIIIKGIYKADTLLRDSNYVLIQVNVTASGQYKISSDTANGFWFRDSGYAVTGLQRIKLRGYGKPILPLNTNFFVTYNNSFCTFTVNIIGAVIQGPVISDYFPTSIGSNWGYDKAGSADTIHVDATAKDSIIAGNTYRVFIQKQNSFPNDTTYYRKGAGNYYGYDALDDSSAKIELLFLKDNVPVVSQWDSPIAQTTYMGLATEVRMHYTILAKNISVNLNGNMIDSVIKVQNDLQYKVFGNFTTTLSFTTFFAKNIGLVDFDVPGFDRQTIKRWKIY